MDIVEVQFIEDTQNAQTGNEFYPAGSRAHFYTNQAGVLVAQGQAVIYKQLPAEGDNILPPAPDDDGGWIPPESKYRDMTVKQLRTEAWNRGIPGRHNMNKATLIAALGSYED